MRIKKFRRFLNSKGQTAMEYMLLLVVAFSLGVTLKKKIEDYLVKNPESFLNKQLSGFNVLVDQDPKFRTFPLRKF